MKDWATTGEAAKILGVTDSRIRQLISEGKLQAEKFGHINMVKISDLEPLKKTKRGRPPKVKKKESSK